MEPDFLTRLPVQIPRELIPGISTCAATVRQFGGGDRAAGASRLQRKSLSVTGIHAEVITTSHEEYNR